MTAPWSIPVPLTDVDRGAVRLRPEPDSDTRAGIAKAIGVDELESLTAEVEIAPWLDGAELKGRFTAAVTQTCGISLEPLHNRLEAEFTVRIVPAGSPNAPSATVHEVEVDPEADDPPDVLDGEVIDVGAYLVEHLALEVDPFPRKPDAIFEAPEFDQSPSPFAALAVLKPRDKAD